MAQCLARPEEDADWERRPVGLLRWPNVVRLKPWLVRRSDGEGEFGKDRAI